LFFIFSPLVESGLGSILALTGFSPLPIAVAGIEPKNCFLVYKTFDELSGELSLLGSDITLYM
jgi:hypothetical protein